MANHNNEPRSTSVTGTAMLQWRCGFDFFVLRRTQEEIAKAYHLSRPTVVRYVQAARTWFTLAPDFTAAPNLTGEMEQRLQSLLGLRRVVVAPVWADDWALTTRLLGRGAKIVFDELVQACGAVAERRGCIGVAGGETMLALALALRPFENPLRLRLYPVVVGPHPDTELSAAAIAGLMARQLGGPRTAPVEARPLLHFHRISIARSANGDAAATLTPEVVVQLDVEALKEAQMVDVAFVGIGGPRPNTTFARLVDLSGPNLDGKRGRFDIQLLETLGLRGEIASQLLPPARRHPCNGVVWRGDENAWNVARQHNATVTGVSLSDLARLAALPTKHVVAVAGGAKQKLEAIWHVVTCLNDDGSSFRPLNTLVTDAQTAEALLNRLQETSKESQRREQGEGQSPKRRQEGGESTRVKKAKRR